MNSEKDWNLGWSWCSNRAAVFAATNEPTWIVVGVAIDAALGWRKPKNQNEDD